jgi:hypothetical protein
MKTFLAKLAGVAKSLWNFYLPLLRSESSRTLAVLLPLAVAVVHEMAKSNLPSAGKRETAVEILKNEALVRGIEAAESLIRYSIESAVFAMKEGER